jgi:hypothetical protein
LVTPRFKEHTVVPQGDFLTLLTALENATTPEQSIAMLGGEAMIDRTDESQ